MESPSPKVLPQNVGADSQSNGMVGNHPPELRSSFSCPSLKNGEVKYSPRRGMDLSGKSFVKLEKGEGGYVLEDIPHLTDYIANLPVSFFDSQILSPDPLCN